jgi:hypothetical protein
MTMARNPSTRRTIARCAIATSFGIVGILPFITSSLGAYSGRGMIWIASLPAWRSAVWFGRGADWYHEIAATSATIMGGAFHGHNQLVQVLVTGGVWYLVCVGLMIWTASSQAVRRAEAETSFGVVYLVALAGTCLLEVSLVLVDNSSMFPVVVVPLAVIAFAAVPESATRKDGGARVTDVAIPVGRRVSGRPSAHRPRRGRPRTAGPNVLVLRHAHRAEHDAEGAEDIAFTATPRTEIRGEQPATEPDHASHGEVAGPRDQCGPDTRPPGRRAAQQNLDPSPRVACSHQAEPNPAA